MLIIFINLQYYIYSTFWMGQLCKTQFYLENQWQKSGQLMKGIIYLEVEKDTPYDIIYMKLISKQIQIKAEPKSITTYQDEYIFLNFDGNKLLKGQYKIPFQLRLPKDLPGTAFLQSSQCEIKCKIALKFVNSQKQNETQIHKHPIKVVKIQPEQRSVASRAESIACCCCCGIGNLEISAQIEKNWAFAGQSVLIKGKIINNTMSPITTYHKLLNNRFQPNFAKTKISKKNNKLFELLWNNSNNLVETGCASSFTLNVKLPEYIPFNTTHGLTVINQYEIAIKCDPGCFKTSVQIQLPLIIYRREINNPSAQIIHLQRWNPFILDAIRFEGLKPYHQNVISQDFLPRIKNDQYFSKELKFEDNRPEPKKKNLMVEQKEGYPPYFQNQGSNKNFYEEEI